MAYYYIFSVFSKIRRWSSNENEHIKRNIVSMPRGYSRFHPVQWSNGGIIVLPNFYSNKFNQFDASLRNSTPCLLRYYQKRIFYKNIDLLKNKMTVIQSSIQNGSSVLFLYWFWSSVFFQLDINATWWNICYSSQWATFRI